MPSSPIHTANATPNTQKPRKPYHTPRIEDYGAVNELTRGGGFNYSSPDGPGTYNSGPN
jgi:hypothetical protein